MSWLRSVALLGIAALGSICLTASDADAQCPTGYPFADNCSLSAAGLNAAFSARAQHVLSNAMLLNTSTVDAPNGVWLDDYAVGNGASPLYYQPSNVACSLNAGNGDNLSQVKSADNKCWILSGTGSITFPSVFGTTPTNVVERSIGNYPTTGEIPAGVLQTYVSKIVIPSTYTQAPWPHTNFSGYCENRNTTTGSSCVPFFSVGLANGGAGSSAYGWNSVLSNTDAAHTFSGANAGIDFGLLANECNPNVWSKTAGVAPAGEVDCLKAIQGGEVNPSGGSFVVHAFPSAAGLKWTGGVVYTEDAASDVPINIGALTTPNPNIPSQRLQFRGYNGASAGRAGSITLDSSGYVRADSGVGFGVSTGGTNEVNLDNTNSSFLPPLRIGSLTQALDANAAGIFHRTTNENLEIRGHVNQASGVVLQSINDALTVSANLELTADGLRLSNNSININGTAAVTFTGTPTASFQVINGIVVHQ